MVLAVVQRDDQIVLGYGGTAEGSGRQPDGKSLVRLGSGSRVFAGEVLAGMSYPDLLREHITGPLGMVDTVLEPREEQCARFMAGYGIPGAAAEPCVSTANIARSGGIYSTADDMARWLRHNLSHRDPAIWQSLALSHAPYLERTTLDAAIGFDEAGAMDAIALAWLVEQAADHRPMILQKSGGLAGFMSDTVFAPSHGVGVFIAANKIDFGMFAGLTEGANDLIASLAPH